MRRLAVVAAITAAVAALTAQPASALSCDNFAPDLQPYCCEFFDGQVCHRW